MSKRRLQHGGRRASKGTHRAGFNYGGRAQIERSALRDVDRWKRASPDPWVMVDAYVIHRKRGSVGVISHVKTWCGSRGKLYIQVTNPGVYSGLTSSPMSVREFNKKWQRACEGCGQPIEEACRECCDTLVQEQLDAYYATICPLEVPRDPQPSEDPCYRDEDNSPIHSDDRWRDDDRD